MAELDYKAREMRQLVWQEDNSNCEVYLRTWDRHSPNPNDLEDDTRSK